MTTVLQASGNNYYVFGNPPGLCQTDLYTDEPPAPVPDIATGFLGPGPSRLGIGPGQSRNPDHPR